MLVVPTITIGLVVGWRLVHRVGAALRDGTLSFRNNPFGQMKQVRVSDIYEIRIETTPLTRRSIDFAMIRTSSGWSRVIAFAVAGEWGLSLRTRNESELARGGFAELIRLTGLTVAGVTIRH